MIEETARLNLRHLPQPLGRLTAPIDYEHYVEKQLKPIASTFTEVLGADLEQLFGAGRQLTLF